MKILLYTWHTVALSEVWSSSQNALVFFNRRFIYYFYISQSWLQILVYITRVHEQPEIWNI